MKITSEQIGWRGLNGSVFMSDLPLRVWPTRLLLESHKTGKAVDFYCAGLHRDADGDITHGTYRSVNFPRKMVLTIFND